MLGLVPADICPRQHMSTTEEQTRRCTDSRGAPGYAQRSISERRLGEVASLAGLGHQPAEDAVLFMIC